MRRRPSSTTLAILLALGLLPVQAVVAEPSSSAPPATNSAARQSAPSPNKKDLAHQHFDQQMGKTRPADGSGNKKDLAHQHFDQAVLFFSNGDYEAPRIEFEAAYRLNPAAADLVYNLSLTAEREGKLDDAIRYMEDYRRLKHQAELAPIDARIDKLRKLQAGQPAAQPATSAPPVQPPAPRPQPPALVQPMPPTPQPVTVSMRATISRLGLGLVGGGAGLMVIGAGCGGGGAALAGQLNSSMPISNADYQQVLSRGEALNAATVTFLIVGGAAVIAGGVYWIYAARSPRR